MSDYTPTTEEVREGYSSWGIAPDENLWQERLLLDKHRAEFDRWLNAERARIWAEGFSAGVNHDLGDWEVAPEPIVNPYEVDA